VLFSLKPPDFEPARNLSGILVTIFFSLGRILAKPVIILSDQTDLFSTHRPQKNNSSVQLAAASSINYPSSGSFSLRGLNYVYRGSNSYCNQSRRNSHSTGHAQEWLVLPLLSLHRPYSNDRAGKQWHEPKSAFRPKAGNSTYEKRQEERKAMAAVKAKEKEMKDEKEAERQVGSGVLVQTE